MAIALLPEGFEPLETWAPQWAMATQNRRWEKRLASTKDEITAFYDAALPQLDRILNHALLFLHQTSVQVGILMTLR